MKPLYWKNIPIAADYGLHEKIFNEFESLALKKNCSILILGSGQGSFDQRIIDAGYTNIHAIDIENNYKAQNEHFELRNLNEDFSDLGKYDVIFCIEIIEHLENTNHFIKNIASDMKNDGYLFISTPNILSKTARVITLFSGKVLYFDEDNLKNTGHITPILDHILEYILRKYNISVIRKTYNRNFVDYPYGEIRFKILSFLVRCVNLFLPGTDGNITIYICKKN